MTFKKFTAFGSVSKSKIIIRTNGCLYISRHILEQFNTSAKFANIYTDENNFFIAVEFLLEKPERHDHRKITQEKLGISINICPVLKFFKVGNLPEKYMTNYDNKDGMLVFSIKNLVIGEKL